ncbi:MAG: hypothetical protein AAF617_04310 [Bacteroidota bacterium]
MHKTESFIEDRIKWRASKRNLPNKHVVFFKDLDKKTRREYLSEVHYQDTGKIVLLFTHKKKSWTAIGTKMIVGFDGKLLHTIAYKDIVSLDAKHLKASLEASTFTRIFFRKKFESDLVIKDIHGNETVFFTHPGEDFFALWNMTMMLARLYNAPFE